MRIVALDASGSMHQLFDQALEHIQSSSIDPEKDIFVTFNCSIVSKPVSVSRIDPKQFIPLAGDGTDLLIDWASARTLQPTDELIIYHDLYFPFDTVLDKLKAGWFTPKFKAIGNPSPAAIRAVRQAGIEVEVLEF